MDYKLVTKIQEDIFQGADAQDIEDRERQLEDERYKEVNRSAKLVKDYSEGLFNLFKQYYNEIKPQTLIDTSDHSFRQVIYIEGKPLEFSFNVENDRPFLIGVKGVSKGSGQVVIVSLGIPLDNLEYLRVWAPTVLEQFGVKKNG